MSYILNTDQTIKMPTKANNKVTEELLSNYTYGKKWTVDYCNTENVITIGEYSKVGHKNSSTVINVTDDGVYIGGCDFSATMHGFITFLESIEYSDKDGGFYIESRETRESPLMDFRCVHLCVFPETKLDFLKKCVRSCGIAKYSHIILEFWGMLKLDCLKELSWPFAHSKSAIKEIVAEANALGVEIIPMFNHLGHASGCREINGKHTVLDQDPSLEYMFKSYGWTWNINRDEVKDLMSKVRRELVELCGEGRYFHIGCDEAYAYGKNIESARQMVEYINDVAKDLSSMGRKTIMWHDMMLSKGDFPDYVAMSTKEVSDLLMSQLDKNILIADWQYWVSHEVWKTSLCFKENGYGVVCCPWDTKGNVAMAIQTIVENQLNGIIHTTWHTLYRGFREMIYAGVLSYGTDKENLEDIRRFYCASVARKAMPSEGNYEDCGWSEKMVGPGL